MNRIPELPELEGFGFRHALQLKAETGPGAVRFKLAHRFGQVVGDGKMKTIVVPKVHIERGFILRDRDCDLFAPEVNVRVVVVVCQVAAVLWKQVFIGKGRGIEI